MIFIEYFGEWSASEYKPSQVPPTEADVQLCQQMLTDEVKHMMMATGRDPSAPGQLDTFLYDDAAFSALATDFVQVQEEHVLQDRRMMLTNTLYDLRIDATAAELFHLK
jgi:hypothetical protein